MKMIDKKKFVLLSLCALFFFGIVSAKKPVAPDWMNAELRAMNYPSETYYTGFAVANIEEGKTLEETIEKLKQTVSGDINASIRVKVQRVSTDSMRNVIEGENVYSKDVFTSVSKLTTGNIEIPGIQVETYYDESKKLAAAFAYVQINGLLAKLQRQLMMKISRLELRLEETEQFLESDNRGKAIESLKSACGIMSDVDETRITMIAIDQTIEGEELMDEEWKKASKKIVELKKILSSNIIAHLTCVSEPANQDLETMVRGNLSEDGFAFVDSIADADWVIKIVAKVTPFNTVAQGNYTFYYTNATAQVDIISKKSEAVMSGYEKTKGGHTLGYDAAAADAVKQLAKQIKELIINKIKK